MNRLREKYQKEILPQLKEEFGYANSLQAPRLQKVVINVGLGDVLANQQQIQQIADNIALIAGQKPVTTKARQSIAGFKIREGETVGLSVTLRGDRMYDFLDRLITVVLPRIRDFRGLSPKSFDGHGNYAIGLKEQIVFPEIPYEKVEHMHGLQINIATTAKNDEEAKSLLKHIGFPFQKES